MTRSAISIAAALGVAFSSPIAGAIEGNSYTPSEIHASEAHDWDAFLDVSAADENGFSANLEGGSLEQEPDGSVIVKGSGGDTLATFESTIPLADGTVAEVDYVVDGNELNANYSEPITQEKISIPNSSFRAAGCGPEIMQTIGTGGAAVISAATVPLGGLGLLGVGFATTAFAGSAAALDRCL